MLLLRGLGLGSSGSSLKDLSRCFGVWRSYLSSMEPLEAIGASYGISNTVMWVERHGSESGIRRLGT